MDIRDAVHTFVSLGNKMSNTLGSDWTPQIVQTERGWGLVACYDVNGSTQAKWSNQLLTTEEQATLMEAASTMCDSHAEKEGFIAICDYLNELGFTGKLSSPGDSEYYLLPREDEFLIKTRDLSAVAEGSDFGM